MTNTATDQSGLQWAKRLLPNSIEQYEIISPDAGDRRYLRLRTPKAALILVDHGHNLDQARQFAHLYHHYHQLHIPVPDILHQSSCGRWMLLRDLGDQRLIDVVNPNNADHFYLMALNLLHKIRQLPTKNKPRLPRFDEAFYQQEFAQFEYWYLQQFRQQPPNSNLKIKLASCYRFLIDAAQRQPHAGTHRDYHSQNLMWQSNHQLAVIDFQDSAIGPISYDVISLLYDCYIDWPPAKIQQWLSQHYLTHIKNSTAINLDTWLHDCELMSIQRHIKVLGTFSRKMIQDNDLRYRDALHRTLNYLRQSLPRHPELSIMNQWIDHRYPNKP